MRIWIGRQFVPDEDEDFDFDAYAYAVRDTIRHYTGETVSTELVDAINISIDQDDGGDALDALSMVPTWDHCFRLPVPRSKVHQSLCDGMAIATHPPIRGIVFATEEGFRWWIRREGDVTRFGGDAVGSQAEAWLEMLSAAYDL